MKYVNTISGLLLGMALLGLMTVSASAEQKLYRWADEHGNQVNSDRPPPAGVDYEVISTQSSMVRAVDSDFEEEEEATAQEDETDASNEPETEGTASTDNNAVKKNPEYCQRARDNLAQLDTKARIRLRDENGEVRYLNEEEIAEQRIRAENAIINYCP